MSGPSAQCTSRISSTSSSYRAANRIRQQPFLMYEGEQICEQHLIVNYSRYLVLAADLSPHAHPVSECAGGYGQNLRESKARPPRPVAAIVVVGALQ